MTRISRNLQENSLIQRKLIFYLLLSLCHRQVTTHVPEFSEDSLEEIPTEIFLKTFRIYHSSLLTLKCSLLSHLREYNIRIRDQEQQLTHLRHQVQEGREVSVLLHQHLSDLLTHDDPDDDQGPGFGEQLAEGCGLAKRLAGVLSSGKVATGPECTELLSKVPGSQETPQLPL